MGWKSLAWAGCLAPVLAGCVSTRHSTCPVTHEVLLAHAQRGIEHDLRKDARTAWQCVRVQYPRRAFTDEFHDGFLDGFVDYLDRGGDAHPPAVPPLKFVRSKKYFTPEGQCLIRDYYLGFKYGSDVAIATGRRQFLTIPLLLPDGSVECPPAAVTPVPVTPAVPYMPPPGPAPSTPLASPRPAPANTPNANKAGDPKQPEDPLPKDPLLAPLSPLPKPELPVIKPFNPSLTEDRSKFEPSIPPPDPDLLPIPDPPLPTIPALPVPPPTDKLNLPVPPGSSGLPTPGVVPVDFRITLPAPPDEVPTLPAHVPTPSILSDIPVIPFKHQVISPVPATYLTWPHK